MRNAHLPPKILLIFLFGLACGRFAKTGELDSGDALNAAVTLFVGLSIQNALRGRAELERIPIEGIARACHRAESMIGTCVELATASADPKEQLIQQLRLLASELEWLDTFSKGVGAGLGEFDTLFDEYVRFKEHLTGEPEINLGRTAQSAGRLRMRCVDFQWKFSRDVLDGKSALASRR